ncbi:hypothetical protein VARIO8X_120578 [Burkholderiales bacterium 8X]|nr:hypothetical protein VARIO8X_120578 [Burkholderiales bacterium 8X]
MAHRPRKCSFDNGWPIIVGRGRGWPSSFLIACGHTQVFLIVTDTGLHLGCSWIIVPPTAGTTARTGRQFVERQACRTGT